LDVGAFVILREAMEDAVCPAAVSADVGDEFLCSAY